MQREWAASITERTLPIADKNLGIILSRFLVGVSVPDGENAKYFNFCKDFSTPIIEMKVITKIITIPVNSATIVERLSPISSLFIFDSDLLASFSGSICKESVELTLSTNILFYFVISWLAKNDLEDIIHYFNELVLAIYQFKGILDHQLYYYIMSSVTSRFFDCGILPFPNSLIQKIFTEVNEYNFDLTVSVLNNAVINRDEDSRAYLVNLINVDVSKNPEKFSQFDFQILVSTLYQYMYDFDEDVLNILSTLAVVRNDPSLIEATADIPAILLSKVKLNPLPKIKPVESGISEIDIKATTKEVSFVESLNDTFPDGLNPLPPSCYDSKDVSFNSLITEEDQKKVNSVVTFLSRADDSYADAFFHSFVERVTRDSFPIFLYILANVRNVKITDKIFVKIFVVFQPGVTVFNQCDNFEIVNFYRKTVLYILSIHSPSQVSRLLLYNESHPFLFADIVGRIQIKISHFNIDTLIDDTTLGTVIKVSTTLNNFYNSGVEKVASQQALSGIFLYLFSILENKATAAKCFVSPVFASGFLSRILEPSMEKPIIEALHTFLTEFTDKDISALMPLVEFVCGILGVCRTLPKEERLITIVINLLSCVNDSIIHNNSITSVFSPVLAPATHFLVEQPSEKILSEVLYLCSLLIDDNSSSDPFVVTQEEAVLLSAATRACESDSLSESTMSRLLNIISSSMATTTKSMFLIKQPIMINVLMSALKNEQQFKDIIELFLKLCHHSLYNCRACHEGELDLLLLEMIKQNGKEFNFRNMTFTLSVSPEIITTLVLPLVTFIASFISSPQIAMSFISIIRPLSDRHFSEFAESTMKAIGSTLVLSSQLPKVVTPLGDEKTYIDVNGIKASHLNQGFTVQFWLQIDSPAATLSQRCPRIFEIEDITGAMFRLHVSTNSIMCNILQTSGLSFAALASNIESEKWILYTLVVRFNSKGAQVSFIYGNKGPSSFTVSLPGFHEGNVSFRIGGIAQGEDSQPFDCRMGDMWFFAEPLGKQQIMDLNNIGARASDVGVFALFSYPVTVIAQEISIAPHLSKQSKIQNLQEIFCAKILDFIPFFGFIDEMPLHFPEQLIDLLQCLISNAKESETEHLFSMISLLLMNTPHSMLTYNLYLKFFSIIENCSITSLIKELIKYILFNPELWCVCEASHLQRIVSHWASGLFSTSPSIFMSVVSISDVLVIMRLYFWYTPIETEIIHGLADSKRPRAANLDVEMCRINLCKLIFSMAFFKFQTRDAIAIISHCSTCPEPKQVVNMMNLLTDIAKSKDTFTFPINISRLVYHQLKPDSEGKFITAIKLLYSLGECDFFTHHLQSILSLFNGSFIRRNLYDVMLEILPQYHLIFPILALLSVALSLVDEFAAVLSTIEITEEEAAIIVKNETWSMWLLLLVIYGSEETKEIIIKFIVKIVFFKPQIRIFDDIFILIDFFAAVTDSEIEKFGCSLTTAIATKIAEMDDAKLCSSFAKRCIKYLLFRINGTETSDALTELFESSPYSIYDIAISKSQVLKLFSLKSFQEIKDVFKTDIPVNPYYFMFRLDYKGNISDKELFAATCVLVDKLTYADEDLLFWKKYLSCMKDHSLLTQSFVEEMNQFLNVYYSSSSKVFLSAVSSFKNIIYKDLVNGEKMCVDAFLSLKVKEIGLASNDMDVYEQNLIINEQITSRLIRKIAKRNINSSSPWGAICKADGSSKSFVFCEAFSQPLLKFNCVYNSTLDNTVKKIDSQSSNTFQARHIRVKGVQKVLVHLYPDFIRIQKNEKFTDLLYSEMHSVLLRNRLHTPNSLEFIMQDGKSYLIDFTPNKLSDILFILMKFQIKILQTVSQQNFFLSFPFTKKWASGEMSNFEYLMILNIFTGRTFHDSSLYPIFPWIITDFTSKELSLTSENTFRDLSQPVTKQKGFMYMTAPLNPSYVKYFLKSIHPFECIKDLESKFSLGEFKSIKETYEKIIDSPNTVELPPEFYFSPEYFDGIELPPWCKSSYEFVYMNRAALESDYVSERLNLWIDLIFGSKSKGVNGNNVFNPVLFEDVWKQWKDTDEAVIESSLRAAGHMPPMIFRTPHPQKNIHNSSAKSKILVPVNYYLDRSDIIRITLASKSNSSLVYFAVCANGEISRFNINFNAPQKSSMSTFEGTISNPKSSIIVPLINGAAVIDPINGTLFSLFEKNIKEYDIDLCSKTVFAASDKNTVVYGCPNGLINKWEKDQQPSKVCNDVFLDYVTSIGFNKAYAVVVAGTKNGSIIANSLRGASVFNTNVGGAPGKILVTKLWGFVVATIPTNNEVVILSVNGKIIKRMKADFTIATWCTWEDKGRDFICVTDDKGRMRVFDILNADISNVVFNCRCSVMAINYISDMDSFGVISADGHCRLIPISMVKNYK